MTDLLVERFWEKVKVDAISGCWNWTAATSRGYGRFVLKHGMKEIKAHRFAYEVNKGKIPPRLQLDHLCRNRGCVNPEHLEPVTNKVNVLRGIGISAQNSTKTHCPQGHPYSGKNLYITPEEKRQCKVCRENRRLELLTIHTVNCTCGHSYFTHSAGKKCQANLCDCIEAVNTINPDYISSKEESDKK